MRKTTSRVKRESVRSTVFSKVVREVLSKEVTLEQRLKWRERAMRASGEGSGRRYFRNYEEDKKHILIWKSRSTLKNRAKILPFWKEPHSYPSPGGAHPTVQM